jgi:hypothetical protein
MINKTLFIVGFALGSAACAYAGDKPKDTEYADQARLVIWAKIVGGDNGGKEAYQRILNEQSARCAAKVPECVDGRLGVIAQCIKRSQEGLDKAIQREVTKLIHNAPKQQ